ncbi:hypothetical protein HWV62_29212 [Athelia sp. TMB]|nr:hypothetical protein HWV62_29212 [Athelia sp. TMB]
MAPGRISLFPDFVVQDAAYNGRSSSSTRVRCLRGTRVLAIKEILRWKDEPEGKPVCWMTGPAGFGKSAILQTVAESSAREGTLAASFFFLRGADGRSRINHFITTLAFQITMSVPQVKPIVEMVLERDPTILHQSIASQFQALIFTPFMELKEDDLPTRILLVVIDGLDECNDQESIQEFIDALASAFQVSPHLKIRWLLASRSEEHIRRSFSGTVSQQNTLILHLDRFDAHSDIEMFLKARFSDIIQRNPRLFRGIPLPWPSLLDLDALVQKSDGLFIFAATLVNFVTDGKAAPNRRLESVLQMHTGLDPLYGQVLMEASEIACFRQVLMALMLLYKEPSVEMLASILELSVQDVLHALLAIQSIIRIPSDDNTHIQLHHTSLRDFLVDEGRSKDLFIDPPAAHAMLAAACVKVLQRNLKEDIFPEEAAMKYTAEYWTRHLEDSRNTGEASPELLGALQDFSSSQVIEPWINMLILAYTDYNMETRLIDLSAKYEV